MSNGDAAPLHPEDNWGNRKRMAIPLLLFAFRVRRGKRKSRLDWRQASEIMDPYEDMLNLNAAPPEQPSVSSFHWRAESVPVPVTPAYPVGVFAVAEDRRQLRVVPDVKKIAVLIDLDLKDYILSLPALDALHMVYGQAEVVLLGLPWHADFLSGRPGPVDRVLVLPVEWSSSLPRKSHTNPASEWMSALVAEHFDLVLQLGSRGWYANSFVQRLGARLTAGFRPQNAPGLDRWVPYSYYQMDVLRYLEAVSLVGAEANSLESHLLVTEADRNEAQQILSRDERPLVVIHPGCADPRRRWPAEKFAAAADSLARTGAQVVFTGFSEDAEIVDEILQNSSQPVQNLCGALSLCGLVGLFSQADVVLANNDGPLHLAEASGAPTVGIYWCADLITSGPITRARHRPVTSWRLICPECGMNSSRSACGHMVSYVADVSVDEVVMPAFELVGMKKPGLFLEDQF